MAFVPQQPKPRYRPGEYAAKMREEAQRWSDPPAPKRPLPSGAPFEAELDLTELDERGRPMLTFIAKSTELGTGHICFRSRRMCYAGRKVIAVLHMVDDEPVPLYGEVLLSEYDCEAMYITRIRILALPKNSVVQGWLAENSLRGRL